ncbi:hypothetical protein J3459_009714 [Metarhizium acridum]|nr:hypothetical protein J3459_009714 [Metarhizium acridum]
MNLTSQGQTEARFEYLAVAELAKPMVIFLSAHLVERKQLVVCANANRNIKRKHLNMPVTHLHSGKAMLLMVERWPLGSPGMIAGVGSRRPLKESTVCASPSEFSTSIRAF